jgi:hypothetical protein
MKRFVVYTLLIFLIAISAQGQEKRTVAVTPTLGKNVSEDIRLMIRSGLEEGVYKSGLFKVVARGIAYQQAMKEFEFQQSSGAVEDNQLLNFGHATGADIVCYASINRISDEVYYLSYKLIDVKTTEILSIGSKSIKTGVEGVVDATVNIANELFGTKAVNTLVQSSEDTGWREMLRVAVNTNPAQSWESGDRYKGQRRNGQRSGFGILYWHDDGDFYIGGYDDGERSGYGIYMIGEKTTGRYIRNCPGCIYYVGEWSKNKKSGMGACYDKNGTLLYYGKFKDDAPTKNYPSTSGEKKKFVVINYKSGGKYVGESDEKGNTTQGWGMEIKKAGNVLFANWNKNNGSDGCIIYSTGVVSEGSWKNGTFQVKK